MLVDASIDLRMQALTFGIDRVDTVLFTHAHADHILGTDDLRCFNFVHRNVIPCYATPETLTKIKETFPYIFEANPKYEGGLLAQLTLNEFKMYQPFEVEGLKVTPLRLEHGSMEVAGFRIGDFAYATDCKRIPEESRKLLRGVKYLILDGLRYEQHKTHLTIEESLEVIADLKPGQTYLTHMTHAVDHDETNSKLPRGVELGYDGLKIEGRG